jgi:hypothetical protein
MSETVNNATAEKVHSLIAPDDLAHIRAQIQDAYSESWNAERKKHIDPGTLCILAGHLSSHIYALEADLSTARREHTEVVAQRDDAEIRRRNAAEAYIAAANARDLLRARVEELEKALREELRALRAYTDHTHSEGMVCTRPACVAHRRITAVLALPPDPATSGGESPQPERGGGA